MKYSFFIFEAKQRIFYCVLSFMACACVVFIHHKVFFYYFIFLFAGKVSFSTNLFSFIDPAGLFICNFWLTVSISSLFVVPLGLVHVSFFIFPASYKHEAAFIRVIFTVFFSIILIGVYFCFAILVPNFWDFFYYFNLGYSTKFAHLQFVPDITKVLSFCFSMGFWVVVFLQFFITTIFMGKNLLISIKSIAKRKVIYFIFAVVGGLLSPPDVLSLVIFIGIFCIFFEFLILMYCVFLKSS